MNLARRLSNGLAGILRASPGSSCHFGPPRRVAATAREWFSALPPSEQRCQKLHELAPERPFFRELPAFADEPIKDLFVNMQNGKLAEQHVVEIAGGRYWGRFYGYIIAPRDILIADISPTWVNYGKPLENASDHEGLRIPFLPPMRKIDGTVLSLNTLFCSNYHHFLIDTLPKLELVGRAGISLSEIDYFVFDYGKLPYQDQAMELLSIDRNKILPSTGHVHFQADRLIVPSYSEPGARVDTYQYSDEGIDFVRALFLADCPQRPARRILLSRRLAQTRRWVEEEDALPELHTMGFERIEAELLTVRDQAKLFSEAEIIVMPHGGGLANCVFCFPGTTIIELFPPAYLPTFMMPLANRLRLQYHALVGSPDPSLDIYVPSERVVHYIKSLGF